MATPLLFIISGVYTAVRNPTDKKLAKILFIKIKPIKKTNIKTIIIHYNKFLISSLKLLFSIV